MTIMERLEQVFKGPEWALTQPYLTKAHKLDRAWVVLRRNGVRVADIHKGKTYRVASAPNDYASPMRSPRLSDHGLDMRHACIAAELAKALGVQADSITWSDDKMLDAFKRLRPANLGVQFFLALDSDPGISLVRGGQEIGRYSLDGSRYRVGATGKMMAHLDTYKPWRVAFARLCVGFPAVPDAAEKKARAADARAKRAAKAKAAAA